MIAHLLIIFNFKVFLFLSWVGEAEISVLSVSVSSVLLCVAKKLSAFVNVVVCNEVKK